MSPNAPPTQFPIDCPRCHAVAAFPFRVATERDKRDALEVSLRCRLCKHEWRFELVSITLGGDAARSNA
jgi:hypothetical protein